MNTKKKKKKSPATTGTQKKVCNQLITQVLKVNYPEWFLRLKGGILKIFSKGGDFFLRSAKVKQNTVRSTELFRFTLE